MNSTKMKFVDDELMVILALLGSDSLGGQQEPEQQGLDEDEAAYRLERGERSLIERGLLFIDDDSQAFLDDSVVAVVGSCIVPDTMLMITVVNPNMRGNAVYYFYNTPHLTVELTSPTEGLYAFSIIPDFEAAVLRMQTLIAPLLASDEDLSEEDTIRLPATVLTNVSRDGDFDSSSFVSEIGFALDSELALAENFLLDYRSQQIWTGMAVGGIRDGDIEQKTEGVIVVASNKGCWIVENAVHDPEYVQIHRANGAQAEKVFSDLVQSVYVDHSVSETELLSKSEL